MAQGLEAPSTPELFSYRSTAVDEVRAVLRASYDYPIALVPLERSAQFAFSLDVVRLGPLVLGDVRYGTDIAVTVPDPGSYRLNVPFSGYTESEHRHVAITSTPELAAVYQPVGDIVVRRLTADCRTLSLKIDRGSLEAELENVLGRTVQTPLRLGPSLDLTRGAGRSWLRLLRLLADENDNPNGLLWQPIVVGRLTQALLTGLLLAVDHQYRDALTQPAGPSRPRTVKRAVDAMRANLDQPLTIAGLAEIAGTSARSLQEGFQRHVGVPPMAYLRELRLARVHEELCHASASALYVTVTEVASRWGFLHLGRFAAAYRRRYGVYPSRTLRGGG